MTAVDFRIPELDTDRLRMRLPRPDDFDAYAEFLASERSTHVGGPHPRDESFRILSAIIGQWWLRGYGSWLVADRDTDAPLGIVGILRPPGWPEPEIGWSVFESAEGMGIAHEAALAARRFAYGTLGWNRIVSLIAPGNARSAALARRLGCVEEGEFNHGTHGPLTVWVHPCPENAGARRTPPGGRNDG